MALPASYRWAVVLTVVVSFQVALSAAFDVQEALHIDSPSLLAEETPMFGSGLSPAAQRQVWLAKRSGYQTAVSGMNPWRIICSALLALGAGLVFALGLRLRLGSEGRGRIAELLGFALVGVAVLRCVDGAQSLVIARTVAEHTGRVLISEGVEDAQIAASVLSSATSVASIIWSLIVVGFFATGSGYFRSDRLREALDRDDP